MSVGRSRTPLPAALVVDGTVSKRLGSPIGPFAVLAEDQEIGPARAVKREAEHDCGTDSPVASLGDRRGNPAWGPAIFVWPSSVEN